MQKLAHAAAGDVVFGMRIGVHALQTLQVGLNEAEATPGSGVVAIHHQPLAKRRLKCRIYADDLLPKIGRLKFVLSHILLAAELRRRQS